MSGSGPHAGEAAAGAPPFPEGGSAGSSGAAADGGSPNVWGGQGGGDGGASAAAGASPEAGAAGAPPDHGEDVYVDPLLGSDAAAGTRREPFKTIQRASDAASDRRSRTIWLLDGTYDAKTEPGFASGFSAAGSVACGEESGVVLPPGIALRAEHAGRAELVVTGHHGLCSQGGELSGLVLRGSTLGRRIVEIEAGSLTIDATTFSSCGRPGVTSSLPGADSTLTIDACVLATGTATVQLRGAQGVPWVSGTIGTFAVARDEAHLSVEQGILALSPLELGLAAFAAGESAQLFLSELELSSSTENGIAVLVQGAAKLRWLGGAVSGFSTAAGFDDVAGASVLVEDVSATNNLSFVDVGSTMPGASEFTLRRVSVSEAAVAVSVSSGDVNLALIDSELRANASGIRFSGPGLLSVENSRLRENGVGLEAVKAYSVKLRRVEISNNIRVGLWLGDPFDGGYDLGTVADPGNNRFTNNLNKAGKGASVLVTGGQSVVVHAVGNVWDASKQGADADGRYAVAGAGAKLEVTGGAGPNYNIETPTRLRLAENP